MKREDLEKFIEENQEEYGVLFHEISSGDSAGNILDSLCHSYENFIYSAIDPRDYFDFHLNIIMEECAELIQAISKYRRAKLTNELKEELEYNLYEEIADVLMNAYRLIDIMESEPNEFGMCPIGEVERILAAKLIRYKKYSEKCLEEGKL